jgi:SAM-dependent methyltransferase
MHKYEPAIWKIESLPFVWGAQATHNNPYGLPDTLPFTLTVEETTGLLVQRPDPLVEEALNRAYKAGSVLGSNVAEDGIGRQYADDFLSFITSTMGSESEPEAQVSVLEIGCGNGYLLSRMRPLFGSAIGIEPGPQGQQGAARYGLNILQGFFPTPEIAGRYSAIVLMSVLEHVQNPADFVSKLRDYLTPNGRIFISVPNEGSYIDSGDVSTLFHEHWSYFDRNTFRATMFQAGLRLVTDCESSFGGSLYASLSDDLPEGSGIDDLNDNLRVAHTYVAQARTHCETLRKACEELTAGRRSLGVFVPARFVNAMGISGIPADSIRFFDDDPSLIGTYYPGIPIAIESRADLMKSPPDSILIMSRTFGPQLAEQLKQLLPATNVLTVADILY